MIVCFDQRDKPVEHTTTKIEVHRSPVVRVDQVEFPQLRPLVAIGNAGCRHFDDKLRQAISHPMTGDQFLKGTQILEERIGASTIQYRGDKSLDRLLIGFVRIDPTGMYLGFSNRLEHVLLDPFGEALILRIVHRIERPRAHQNLIKEILFISIRRRRIVDVGPPPLVELGPAVDRSLPALGNLR